MVEPITLGHSREGRAIEAWVFGRSGGSTLLIFGAFHGDEPKSVYVARRLIDALQRLPRPPADRRWVIVPVVNPDGWQRRRRRNAARVDINRNFPTTNWSSGSRRSRMYGGAAPASEPETRVVMKAVRRYRPAAIITLHSIGLGRFCNNYDGPGRALAGKLRRCNGYPVRGSIGYPTPGSFGAWAGIEGGIPTITLELPSHHSRERCWRDNREALLHVELA